MPNIMLIKGWMSSSSSVSSVLSSSSLGSRR